MATLTRAKLISTAAPRYELIEVEGFGKVGLRSVAQMQLSRRYVSYTDPLSGATLPDEQAKSGIHKLIDQLMTDEKTPMFTDEDIDLLAGLDAEKLSPLYDAIDVFNDDQKKV